MKSQKNFHAFIIFLVLLISIFILLKYYSGQISIRKDGYYEVVSRVKGEYAKTEEIRNRLKTKIKSPVVIENISKDVYRLIFGKYADSFEAGEMAFNLYSDSLIQNYTIMLDGKEVYDNYTNILFVARNEQRTSLFTLNLVTKKETMVWNDWGEEVVAFEMSAKNKFCFFLTVSGTGRKTGTSYLNDARLYHYDMLANKIKMVDYLANGYQFYSYWNAANQYLANFNSLDSLTNQEVFQNYSVFDTLGVKIKSLQKKYNLIKDGYPNPPQKKLDFTSTMNRYLLYTKKNDKNENSFYIKKSYTNQEYLILASRGNISDIVWSNDEKYLFFVYSDIKNISKKVGKNEYFCMVFDTDLMQPVHLFKGADFSRISVLGKLLAVETGAGPGSKIMFYDYIKDKIYLNLDIKGGCAIKNLPLSK